MSLETSPDLSSGLKPHPQPDITRWLALAVFVIFAGGMFWFLTGWAYQTAVKCEQFVPLLHAAESCLQNKQAGQMAFECDPPLGAYLFVNYTSARPGIVPFYDWTKINK